MPSVSRKQPSYFDDAMVLLQRLATVDAHCGVGSISQLPKDLDWMRLPFAPTAYQDIGY